MYSTYDSSLSLSGTPAKIGTYPVNVTVTDESGRTVTSNELTFKVYSTKEKLADHLKLENATKTADGKYIQYHTLHQKTTPKPLIIFTKY